jgi:hypothetical protein
LTGEQERPQTAYKHFHYSLLQHSHVPVFAARVLAERSHYEKPHEINHKKKAVQNLGNCFLNPAFVF